MFKDTPEGQTNYCTHQTGGICDRCLGKKVCKECQFEGGEHSQACSEYKEPDLLQYEEDVRNGIVMSNREPDISIEGVLHDIKAGALSVQEAKKEIMGYFETTKGKCKCVCHQNKLKKLYEHDTKCCEDMNGFVPHLDEGHKTHERGEFWHRLEDVLDDAFPKGKCKERGNALVLYSHANILHNELLTKERQRVVEIAMGMKSLECKCPQPVKWEMNRCLICRKVGIDQRSANDVLSDFIEKLK